MPIFKVKPYKTLRRYPLALAVLFSAVIFGVLRIYWNIDLFENLLDRLARNEHLEADEVVFFAIVSVLALAADQTRNVRRIREKNTLHKGRLQAVRSTMTSVHDIVNNALNNLVLIRLEAEKTQALSPQTLAEFERLIEDTAAQLREIDGLEALTERTLAPGLSRLEVGGNAP